MKYVSPEYERQLSDLAETLRVNRTQGLGQLSLADTVESLSAPSVPPTLRLLQPPEAGWEYTPPGAA